MFIDQLQDDELQGFFEYGIATDHTAAQTVAFVEQYSDDRIIERNRWPPRSPNLTPLDYFLFGHLRNVIYRNRLHTIDELRAAIETTVQYITQQQLHAVFKNMKKWKVVASLDNGGDPFEHLFQSVNYHQSHNLYS